MGTNIRATLSTKNKYWIEKHRYYELKHFCLQYPIWKSAYASLDGLSKNQNNLAVISNNISDPTAKCAEAKEEYIQKIKLIEDTAHETNPELARYIIEAVTKEHSYPYLSLELNMPCCKETYYIAYRKFFWLLNKMKM